MAGFPKPASTDAPILNLASEALLRDLLMDDIHALLCNAALHAFARRVRQEEVIELGADETASLVA